MFQLTVVVVFVKQLLILTNIVVDVLVFGIVIQSAKMMIGNKENIQSFAKRFLQMSRTLSKTIIPNQQMLLILQFCGQVGYNIVNMLVLIPTGFMNTLILMIRYKNLSSQERMSLL